MAAQAKRRTRHGRQPATTSQYHPDSTSLSGCLHMNVRSQNVLMKRRSDRLKFRAGTIWSATDCVGEVGCSFRESLGVANTGREWPGSEIASGVKLVAARRYRDMMRRNHIGSRFPRDRRISNLMAGHPVRFPAGCVRRLFVTLPSKKSNKTSLPTGMNLKTSTPAALP